MSNEVLTEVSARVPNTAGDVVAEFARLLEAPLPDGLLRTELLRAADDKWRIQSLWRDQAALEAMRSGPEPPAAPALFIRLGAEPTLHALRVEGRSRADHPTRIVCTDAQRAALNNASASFKIRHTANAADRVHQAREQLGLKWSGQVRSGQVRLRPCVFVGALGQGDPIGA